MGMVFCRGCGKEIHDTATACPLCGAPQAGPGALNQKRGIGRLIGWGAVWTCVLWVLSLFAIGFIAGAMHPETAQATGERLGQEFAGPMLLVALLLSALLTGLGLLPGTRKSISQRSV